VDKLNKEGHAEMDVNQMPTGLKTLPEIFKQAGYRTFGLAANINIGDDIGFSRGFDKFSRDIKAPAKEMYDVISSWRKEIVDAKPFFLYLHFNDAHTPYNKRHPYYTYFEDTKSDARSRYRSEISYMDQFLEKTWHLEGISDNTVLMILSDHGEEFWEHGDTEHGPTLYAELNRVLMMMHGPSAGIRPMRVTENVSLVDVVPTLATLAGVTLDTEREGRSLLPLFSEEQAATLKKQLENRYLFAHRMFSSIRKVAVWSITSKHLKLIDWWGARRKLFNHERDPGEKNDIAKARTKSADRLSRQLTLFKRRINRHKNVTATTGVPLDDALIKSLESLGYMEK
jgi:arylsulfatase A-like enzyme